MATSSGIQTVQDLASKSEDDMIKVRNLGKKSLKEVKEKLIELIRFNLWVNKILEKVFISWLKNRKLGRTSVLENLCYVV